MEKEWEKEINSKLLHSLNPFAYNASVFNDLSNIAHIDMESLKKGIKEKELDEKHTFETIYQNCFHKMVDTLTDFISAPLNCLNLFFYPLVYCNEKLNGKFLYENLKKYKTTFNFLGM